MKLKLNIDLKGHKKGDVVRIKDIDGVPVEPYWRKRLKDAQIDNCVELYTEEKTTSKTKVKSKSKGDLKDDNS
jgi:hypothetical protein